MAGDLRGYRLIWSTSALRTPSCSPADQEQCDQPERPELVELRRYDGDEPAGWAMVMPEGKVVAHIRDRTGAATGLASMYSSLDSAERLLSYCDVYLCTSEMGCCVAA